MNDPTGDERAPAATATEASGSVSNHRLSRSNAASARVLAPERDTLRGGGTMLADRLAVGGETGTLRNNMVTGLPTPTPVASVQDPFLAALVTDAN